MINTTIFIGVFGLLLLLINLFLLETSKVKAKSKEYLLMGVTGGFLITLYSWLTGDIIFIILNGVFVLSNIFWLFRLHR